MLEAKLENLISGEIKERERERERDRVVFTWNRATIAKGKDSSNSFTPNFLLMLSRPFLQKASHKTDL